MGNRVLLKRIDGHISAKSTREVEPISLRVDGNELPWIEPFRRLQHAQANISDTRHNHRVSRPNIATIYGMNSASQWLDVCGLAHINAWVNAVNYGSRGVNHIFSHAALGPALEAEDNLRLAHPVSPCLAESAGIAGNDLFGNDVVTHRDAMALGGALSQLDNDTGEFVAGRNRRHTRAPSAVNAPEHRATGKTLHIACADAGRANLYQDLTTPGRRPGQLSHSIIEWTIAYNGVHRFRRH
jgi:hypothetical protein